MENVPIKTAKQILWYATCLTLGIAVGTILGRCLTSTPEPITFTKVNVIEVIKFEETNSNRECLAQALFAEFRSETAAAAIAGGEVILNRVNDKRYPNTICEVVRYKNKGVYHFSYQYKTDPNFYKTARVFSSMRVTSIEIKAKERAYEIADNVMASVPALPSDALNYHTIAVKPSWAHNLQKNSQIGKTIFYRGY